MFIILILIEVQKITQYQILLLCVLVVISKKKQNQKIKFFLIDLEPYRVKVKATGRKGNASVRD